LRGRRAVALQAKPDPEEQMKNQRRMRRRAGFTLIETIVTVGLISVLAAFVVPTVIQKSVAADPVKVSNDLNAVRTGLESFANDTKAGIPNEVFILTSRPTALNHLVDSTTAITLGQIAVWNGPYISATIGAAATDSIATGFTAFIRNHIERYDILNNAGEFNGGTGTFSATSTLFAAIRVDGLTVLQAAQMNAAFDGVDDPPIAASQPNAGANTTGRFRYDPPVNGLVRAYYLALPII
jgi:prepilin-type N-terminal cleavage/methylation domain-containing protein